MTSQLKRWRMLKKDGYARKTERRDIKKIRIKKEMEVNRYNKNQ